MAFNGWEREKWYEKLPLSQRGLKVVGFSSACHYISPEKGEWGNICHFSLQGLYVGVCFLCVCEWPLRPRWAVRTTNVNHVWCATCGIFITEESQKVTHACNTILVTRMNGGDMVSWGWTKSQLPLNLLLPPPPTHINVYTNSHNEKLQVFSPKCTGCIWVTTDKLPPPKLWSHVIGQAVTHTAKACTQTPKHVDTPVDTNRSGLNPPHAIRGPADPLQPQQLYILRFMILTSYVSATGLHGRDQLKWKGPYSSFLLRPPKLWTQLKFPTSRCESGGILKLQ